MSMFDGFLMFYLKFKTFVIGVKINVVDDYKVNDYFVWNVVKIEFG